jgi:hypothetical protein
LLRALKSDVTSSKPVFWSAEQGDQMRFFLIAQIIAQLILYTSIQNLLRGKK